MYLVHKLYKEQLEIDKYSRESVKGKSVLILRLVQLFYLFYLLYNRYDISKKDCDRLILQGI